MSNTLVVRGFVNKIDFVASKKKDEPGMFFAKIAYSKGEGEKRKTQYMSCFISKSLHGLAQAAYDSQSEVDGKTKNVLGGAPAELTVVDPYFEVNEAGYLEGSGILTAISYDTPELKQKASK